MEDYIDEEGHDAYIFCKKHVNAGIEAHAKYGRDGIKGKISDSKKQKFKRIQKAH